MFLRWDILPEEKVFRFFVDYFVIFEDIININDNTKFIIYKSDLYILLASHLIFEYKILVASFSLSLDWVSCRQMPSGELMK